MPEGLTGSLAQLPLADLLKMLAAGGQNGRLELTSGLDTADIYLAGGAVVHAESGPHWGEQAFLRLVAWPNGQFRFEPGVQPPDRTIDKPLDALLADAARAAGEREAMRRVIPSMDTLPRLVRKAPGPSVTIEAADWETLALIDGQATAASIAAELGVDDFEAVRRLYRLRLAGLIDLTTPQAAPAPVRQLAGAQFFQALTTAVAAALGPLAEIIIDDAVEDLGFTRATLPRDAVASLAERISGEIRDTGKRVRFQQTMLAMLRQAA
jgi:hypothetical protein